MCLNVLVSHIYDPILNISLNSILTCIFSWDIASPIMGQCLCMPTGKIYNIHYANFYQKRFPFAKIFSHNTGAIDCSCQPLPPMQVTHLDMLTDTISQPSDEPMR